MATGLCISIRTAAGRGRTSLSAFDDGLARAGAGDFNLIRLSSVIPQDAEVVPDDGPLDGGYADRLYCVYAAAHAVRPGQTVWAGLGWTRTAEGHGLFVEHTGDTEEQVLELIGLTLADMDERRGGGYGPVETVTVSAHHDGLPACALALAAYHTVGWDARPLDRDESRA